MGSIIDSHSHLFGNEADIPEFERAADTLGIVKICFMGLEFPGSPMSKNTSIREAMRRRPDLAVGFGGIDLWKDVDASRVDRLCDEGFTGLKFILPPLPYHDPRYYPYYRRASELGMPVCFHTGVIARIEGLPCRVDSDLMRPVHLDTIAREFPDLVIWGAHLGNPWYEEAAMCCRWNPNLFFDLSGSTLSCKRPSFIGDLLWWTDSTSYTSPDGKPAWRKILFGSDVPAGRVAGTVEEYTRLIGELSLEPFADFIFYETAAATLRKAGVEC